jgi:phosphohistidine phosphatase SixA
LEMVHSFFVAIKDFFPTILLISHNPLITNWADNLINITKTDNISTVSQK